MKRRRREDEVQVNPYRPELLRIVDTHDEADRVRTLRLDFAHGRASGDIRPWKPGQFGEFSVFGAGESVFAISNAASVNGARAIECTFRAVGKVTNALRRLGTGDVIGFRGPYGNAFPMEQWTGKHLAFIGGGIGMAALRAAIQHALGRRELYEDIHILNGARQPSDLVYRDDMDEWAAVDGVDVIRTVDPGGEPEDWNHEVGLLPDVFERLALDPVDRVVIACGPPIMLGFLFRALERMSYRQEQVVTTLENKMKCGIGVCGRCSVGRFYVCRDGPVVTWSELGEMPKDL